MTPPEDNYSGMELPSHRPRNSISSSHIFNLTPPSSPPENLASSSRIISPRAPGPAHIDAVTAIQPGAVIMPTLSRGSPTLNPYTMVSSGQYGPSICPPPEYSIASDPASPISPSFSQAAYPQASNAADVSLFDRWLQHEDLARPIFPGSRTCSSVATSDISSVREGMFGSLPSLSGGQGAGESRSAQDMGRRAGSVSSRGTRDRENFSSSSVPSYPSSRSGGSRPSSRWGGEEHVPAMDGEIFPTSIPASPTISCTDNSSRSRFPRPAPPPAPTPPITIGASSSAVNIASTEAGGNASRVSFPERPEAAATRPPRYSDTFAGAIGLEELINRDIAIGGQGVIPIHLKSEKAEKGSSKCTNAVMLVQEDIWIEMTRLAGLARQQGYSNGTSNGGIPSGAAGDNVNLENGTSRELRGRVPRKRARQAACCGICIIS